jgi:nitroimidazol reductase NimA-like FMN-containing flavoprotein (pyridoxamine 5'-phosphate oxidase superfamily)
MQATFKQKIVELLEQHRTLTIATNRADGWPQATVVSYANDNLVIYTFVGRSGQKFANIQRNPRVSVAIAKDSRRPLAIRGLSLGGRALIVDDQGEVEHASALLLRRYPEYRILPPPNPAEVALLRITPEVVSILDYSKGFGHTDLVRVSERDLADFVESHRHHWAMRPVERGQGDQAWFVDD